MAFSLTLLPLLIGLEMGRLPRNLITALMLPPCASAHRMTTLTLAPWNSLSNAGPPVCCQDLQRVFAPDGRMRPIVREV